ncbi:paraneoplastic antigen Ma1 homolog [Hemitrygon akajei]|uniref:paraneoplastic antigen Ma1 homolog n=1 Tax=Hemitrygon akajei TaxID=2704970 RepID=UPI003BF9DA03
MDRDKIVNWCELEDVPVNYACVLSGVDFRILDGALVQGLSLVKGMGQIELVARRCGKEVEASWVLVRMSADVMTLELPAPVSVPGETGPWGLHILPEDEGEETLEEELDVTSGEVPVNSKGGSEWEGLARLYPPAGGEASELAAALISLTVSERPRLKLGFFSGATTTSDGEVAYDTWIENMSLLFEAWPGLDEEKRRRLMGSLRGMVARVVRELKAEQPSASLGEYLEVLEGAFRMSGDSWLLLAEFHHMEQERGEKLSEYIFWLERMLTGLRRWGGSGGG